MKDLIDAYVSWCGLRYIDWEERRRHGACTEEEYHAFIDHTKQVRDFLQDYSEGLVTHQKHDRLRRTEMETVVVDGIIHEGKAIDTMFNVLSRIREFNLLSFDARGELSVKFASLLMDYLEDGNNYRNPDATVTR